MSIKKNDKKTIRSWMMYDWANSVYNLVIVSAIFPIFYGGLTKEFGDKVLINENEQIIIKVFGYEFINTALLSYVGALGFLIVALISPILSGVADYIGRKKMFMRIFAYMGSFACMGLYFFDFNNLEIGFLFYLLALVGFWGSLVYYNAYLPEIADKKFHDKISAGGFSMGYIGSVILLLICLILITTAETVELKRDASRLSFLLTGIWWFGFSHIFFYRVKDSKEKYKLSTSVFGNGFRELKIVLKEFMQIKTLKRFLPAFFMISCGVQTVMVVAVVYAEKNIAWGKDGAQSGLILSILLIQLIAIPGALGMAWVSKKIGNVKALQIIVFAWVLVVSWAYFVKTPFEFYVTAACVGLVMGSVQALSRSTYSKFLPETEDTSSYFSFYDVTEKLALVVGLFLFAFLEEITGSMRNSILSIAVFFILGFILLSFVPKDRIAKK